MQKVQLKFHSIALCLRNNFSKWLPLSSAAAIVVVVAACYSPRLVDEQKSFARVEEFQLFRLFFCVEYFHVFMFALRSLSVHRDITACCLLRLPDESRMIVAIYSLGVILKLELAYFEIFNEGISS